MKRILLIAIGLLGAGQLMAQVPLGEVVGEVHGKGGEALYNAHVFIEDQGKKYQTRTEFDGRFRISAIPAGEYELKVRYEKDTLDKIFVDVPIDGFYNTGVISFEKAKGPKDLVGTVVSAKGRNKIVMIDGNLPVTTITAKEIDKSPAKFDVKGLISSMSSDVRQTSDGELVFRGARKGDMIYLVDGVKTRDVGSVPGVSIGRMQIYTGGLPARYGDTLGGVVVMESKSYFDLYRSWKAQQLKAGKM